MLRTISLIPKSVYRKVAGVLYCLSNLMKFISYTKSIQHTMLSKVKYPKLYHQNHHSCLASFYCYKLYKRDYNA